MVAVLTPPGGNLILLKQLARSRPEMIVAVHSFVAAPAEEAAAIATPAINHANICSEAMHREKYDVYICIMRAHVILLQPPFFSIPI